jgi:membrane-associated protein
MFDVTHIVQSGGLLLLGLFIFSEVGLFLGFFLPGDTLLITAGIFAMEGKLPLVAVIIVAAIAAIAGDSTAYFIGRKLGPRIFKNEDSVLFRPEHVKKAEKFFERYGSKTVLFAHFLPIVRTFSPLLAGVAKMPYRTFLSFDAIGDTAWAIIITLFGYYVGSRIPNIDTYILIVIIGVVVISLSPTLYQIARKILRKRRAKAKKSK